MSCDINYKNLKKIEADISKISNVNLMIVTKNRSVDTVRELILNGYKIYGENKVQEANGKFQNLQKLHDIHLHLIGPLQSNKVKVALNLFDTIQTIDRPKIINEICKFDLSQIKTKSFFIQVNIGKEEQKSGVKPDDLKTIYELAKVNNLNIVGLMCIPPNNNSPEIYFKKMIDLRDELDKNLQLSMGMSGDYKTALKFDTNLIRIGSLLFN